MSSTSSASAASPSCTGSIWVLPTQDSACALPNTGNSSAIMDKCCKPAKVTKYDDDCGLYCLAQEQSVKDLLGCISENGAKDGEYFCNDKMNATATAAVPTASKTGDSSKASGTSSSTSSGSESSETSSSGAVVMRQPITKSGLGVVAMMLCGALLGVVA